MPEINIIPANHQTNSLQNLAAITPPEKVKKTSPISQDEYLSNAEKNIEFYGSFWEGLLTLFIKIPFMKNLPLTIWRFGLYSLQPSSPIKNEHSLLFNSSIEIPKWFNEEMQYQASLTLCKYFLTELKMVREKASIDLNTIIRLSQVSISRELYNYPDIIQDLRQGLQETTYVMIEKIRKKHPNGTLIHLGGKSYESPLERRPLTGLFMQAFTDCLKTHKPPIHFLHIYGPCDNNDALKIFLTQLHHSHSLLHLHLDFDEATSKKAFSFLGTVLKKNTGLQELVFRNYARNHKFWILDEYWLELAESINSHHNLSTLSFYDLPKPPKIFHQALRGYQIKPVISSQEGFCIKKA